jgi:hypothetical protein
LSKKITPSKIPMTENLELALMENLANFIGTQVEGGKRKKISKRKTSPRRKGRGLHQHLQMRMLMCLCRRFRM